MSYVAYDVRETTQNLVDGASSMLPELLLAILVLVVGWVAGGMLGSAVSRLFKTLKLDSALDKAGVDELSKRAGYSFAPSQFAGTLVKWFVILVFTIVALDILRLQEVTYFMREVVLGYLPQVFIAVLILFAGAIVANITRDVLVGALRASGTNQTQVELYGKVAYVMVIGFAIMAALNQMHIAADLINTLFMGIVFAVSLATGLAFGFGGKEAASRFINKHTGGGSSHHSGGSSL